MNIPRPVRAGDVGVFSSNCLRKAKMGSFQKRLIFRTASEPSDTSCTEGTYGTCCFLPLFPFP